MKVELTLEEIKTLEYGLIEANIHEQEILRDEWYQENRTDIIEEAKQNVIRNKQLLEKLVIWEMTPF